MFSQDKVYELQVCLSLNGLAFLFLTFSQLLLAILLNIHSFVYLLVLVAFLTLV